MCDDRLRGIDRFIAEEARLLDAMRYEDWLGLLTEDISYRVPLRRTRRVGSARTGYSAYWPGEDDELAFMLFDEDARSLRLRVDRLQTGLAHGEVPPSATQRVVAGVISTPRNGNGSSDGAAVEEYDVYSTFSLTQIRHDRNEDEFRGHRHDVIRFDDGPKLASRRVHLVQSVLPRAISVLF